MTAPTPRDRAESHNAENDAPVCPWCKATGADPCRTTDGQRRVPHKARARMERAARTRPIPPGSSAS